MPYKTPSGDHYHMTYGCHGATIPCDTKGLAPCSDCCGKDGGAGSPGAGDAPAEVVPSNRDRDEWQYTAVTGEQVVEFRPAAASSIVQVGCVEEMPDGTFSYGVATYMTSGNDGKGSRALVYAENREGYATREEAIGHMYRDHIGGMDGEAKWEGKAPNKLVLEDGLPSDEVRHPLITSGAFSQSNAPRKMPFWGHGVYSLSDPPMSFLADRPEAHKAFSFQPAGSKDHAFECYVTQAPNGSYCYEVNRRRRHLGNRMGVIEDTVSDYGYETYEDAVAAAYRDNFLMRRGQYTALDGAYDAEVLNAMYLTDVVRAAAQGKDAIVAQALPRDYDERALVARLCVWGAESRRKVGMAG